MDKLPGKKELLPAIIKVLKDNNGALSAADMNDKVAELLQIPQELLEIEDANCTSTEFSYRMRWARTELKSKEVIMNPERGKWVLV